MSIDYDIDDALSAIYDVTDADSYVIQSILQYCHEHQREIQEWMAIQASLNTIKTAQSGSESVEK